MNRIANLLYRPTENHVGVIYRCGRFNRFVDPDRWVFTIPWFETVSQETKLDMRTIQISLKDIYTREKIALDVDLKIFYLVDLREADAERRIQVLRFPTESAWDEIVRTGINDVARNMIFITKSFEELVTQDGRSYLKQALSSALAERVHGFGALLNPRFGVNIVDIQPNEEYRRAMKEESVAKAIGSAAAIRLEPLMEQFSDKTKEKAFFTLILQIAAAVAKTGQPPDIIFPDPNGFSAGGMMPRNGRDQLRPSISGFSPSSRKPKSVAGD
jgi:regulator of protease activity HflC (stomatin/prohibitin superfamily)